MSISRARPLQSATALLKIPGPPPRNGRKCLFSSSAPRSQTQTKTPGSNVDDKITTLPLFQSLRKNPLYKESRPHLTIPHSTRRTHLVAGSLSGPEMISVAPYTFTSKPVTTTSGGNPAKRSTVYSIFYAGRHTCGHPGFVHGGLLSVMFDEAFARCVSTSFASGLGMTANLSVDYRKPALPGRVFVLYAETVDVQGRKAWTEGVLSMCSAGEEEDVVVAEGRSLFIEPKFVQVCFYSDSCCCCLGY